MARGDILIRAANLLDTHREEIAQIECSDSGKPILETRLDIQSAIDALKYCGGTSPALLGGETQQGAGWKGHSRRIPCGVVAGIGAWVSNLLTCELKVCQLAQLIIQRPFL